MIEINNQNIRKAYHPDLVILVVEDQMMFIKDIKHALPQHKIVFARTVEEAKSRYDDCLPDLTFIDIDLPDGNGFELLDHIHACEPEAYTVMLTGSKICEDVARSQLKGAQGYIIKPFTKSKIEQTVEKYLDVREKGIQFLLGETEKRRQNAMITQSQTKKD